MPSPRNTKWATLRLNWAASSLRDWLKYRRRRATFLEETRATTVHRVEEPLGHRTRHTYLIADGLAFTTSQMDQRWRLVAQHYPPQVTSLLDIGCCRGWFVIQAALRPECERAVGIDVVQGFIDAANEAKRLLKLEDKVHFAYAFLDDIVARPDEFRPPYQTIILINTYHYMYWGSGYSDKHWADHDYLLRTLASICTDRVIFMSPLEVVECPSDIVRRAEAHPDWATEFTEGKFLEVAARYFDVRPEGFIGLRPLYLLMKK